MNSIADVASGISATGSSASSSSSKMEVVDDLKDVDSDMVLGVDPYGFAWTKDDTENLVWKDAKDAAAVKIDADMIREHIKKSLAEELAASGRDDVEIDADMIREHIWNMQLKLNTKSSSSSAATPDADRENDKVGNGVDDVKVMQGLSPRHQRTAIPIVPEEGSKPVHVSTRRMVPAPLLNNSKSSASAAVGVSVPVPVPAASKSAAAPQVLPSE